MDPLRREPDDRTERADDATAASVPEPGSAADAGPDLERIAGDLADIEVALDRLSDGTYWTDEITGETIPDAVLAEDPTARRVAYVPMSRQPADPTGPTGEPTDAALEANDAPGGAREAADAAGEAATSAGERADEAAPADAAGVATDPGEPPTAR